VVFAEIAGGKIIARFLAEIDAARQFAHDHDIHALEYLGPDRGRAGKFRVDLYRSQVCEYPEDRAESQQSLLGPDRCIRIGPLRAADGAKELCMAVPATRYRAVGKGLADSVDCCAADQLLAEFK
jgi:hypothetical protein